MNRIFRCLASLMLMAIPMLMPLTVLQGAEPVARPNIVLIMADDLGWSDTTLYGTTEFYRTPNLERLAKRGMTFTRAYSASPLCSPTRSAILTGLSPARTGITAPVCHLPAVVLEATLPKSAPAHMKALMPESVTRLKTEYRTLADSLKEAGYSTGHFGKWHLGSEPYSPLEHSFDVDVPHHAGPGPAGSYVAPWKFKSFDPDPNEPEQHIEDRIAREAVSWMEQQADRPFFLNYWMFSVHAPFDAKKSLIEKHRPRVNSSDLQRSPTYAAMIESMDDAVGTLLDAIDRLQIADNTIILFTSDNGGNMYSDVDGTQPTSNRPLRGGKATMYEGGTRVPCIIAWPGITSPGSRSDALIQSEDYYPTFLAGLDLATADGQRFDGISILPALRGEALSDRALFQYFPHNPAVPDWLPPCVSVHQNDWKLIRIFHGGEQTAHRYQLFNLRDDLGETTNLAMRFPERVRELDALIEDFLTETGAVSPQPNPKFDPAEYHPEREGQPGGKKDAPKSRMSREGSGVANSKQTAARDDGDPALQGWKARGCKASVSNGVLSISQLAESSFLGIAAGRHSGPSTVTMRIRAEAGESHIDWLPKGPGTEAHQTTFRIRGSEWEEISVELPATGPLGVVRVYLPPQSPPIQIDWIEITSHGDDRKTRTNFDTAR